MTDEPTPGDAIDPAYVDTSTEFAGALGRLLDLSGLTEAEVAQESKVAPYRVNEFLNGIRLPTRSEMHNLLLVLAVRSSHQEDDWQLALMRIQGRVGSARVPPYVLKDTKKDSSADEDQAESSESEEDDQIDLLLRVYIPSERLYATEASRLLSLFREWLTTTRGYSVRQSGYHTASGDMYEFFVDASTGQPDLREEFDSFSDFLTLCSENS